MPRRIGIEIGTDKTKIVVGHFSRGDYKVTGYEIIDTVEGVYTIDGDTDILKMEFPIKETLTKLGVKSGELRITMNNEKVIIRTRELPRVSPKDMKEVVLFEAENFLPYDISEFCVDYKVLNEVEEENNIDTNNLKETLFNVMIIAAPKDIIDQYITLAERVKLKLKMATVYTESVSKYLIKNILNESENMLFVDIGSSFTNMIMCQGSNYFANIKADIGVAEIQERLVELHGFNLHDVKHHLFPSENNKEERHTYTDEDKLEIIKSTIYEKNKTSSEGLKLQALQKKLEKIRKVKKSFNVPESEIIIKRNEEYLVVIKEINRMVEFFKSRKYGTFVDKIYLFGGGAYLIDFIDVLSNELGINCYILPDIEKGKVLDREHFQIMLSTVGSCIGGKS